MKRINWFLLFFCFSLSLSGQRSSDYGVFLGASSYLGDINPKYLLYYPKFASGIFYRYNFHPRQALRTNVFFSNISISKNNQKNVLELALQYEFNFFPYSTQGKRWNYTPYFAAGAGIAYIIKTIPVIPFSFGFKINLYKNLGLEAEYGFRKTFYDNFEDLEDELVDPATRYDNAWIHNNDWYSFLGVGVTWKIFSKSGGCPAFSDVDPKRKR